MGDLLNSAESLEPSHGGLRVTATLGQPSRTATGRLAFRGPAVRPKGHSMSPVALNVFDITIGFVLVSFAIWGFIITVLTAGRGSAYSRMPIVLLRKWNGDLPHSLNWQIQRPTRSVRQVIE